MLKGPGDELPCHYQPQAQYKTPGTGVVAISHGTTQPKQTKAASYTSHDGVCAAPTSSLPRWAPIKRPSNGTWAFAQCTVDRASNPTRSGLEITQPKQPRVQATSYTSHDGVGAAPTSSLPRWAPVKRSDTGKLALAQYTVDRASNPTRTGLEVTCPNHLKLKRPPTRHGSPRLPCSSRLQWRKVNK
jgi:hypothetical protein